MGDDAPSPLPPGVWAEHYTYANGKTEVIYKQAMSEEGPYTVTDGQRMRHLVYMYGHWVFAWAESAKTVNIGFGTIDKHTSEYRDVPISTPWDPNNLITFGRRWRQQLINRVT